LASTGYTSKKKPWKLVYFESFPSKSEAIKREIFLKKQRNKDFYDQLISTMKADLLKQFA
jgi:putative endonuclease